MKKKMWIRCATTVFIILSGIALIYFVMRAVWSDRCFREKIESPFCKEHEQVLFEKE